MKIYQAYILFLSLVLFIACTTTTHHSSQFQKFSPKETDVPGWGLMEKPVYLSLEKPAIEHRELQEMGIIESEQARYLSYSDKTSIISVDVFRAGSMLDAFGMFSIERSNVTNPISITWKEYFVGTGLFMCSGNFYIRITCNISDYRTRGELEFFKKIIIGKITPVIIPGSIPPFVQRFCNENQLLKLVYLKNGHPLVPGSLGMYLINEESTTFFMKNPSIYETGLRFNDILKKSSFTISKSGDIQLALRDVKNRFIFISFRDIWIFGVLNAENITVGNESIQKLYNRFTPGTQ